MGICATLCKCCDEKFINAKINPFLCKTTDGQYYLSKNNSEKLLNSLEDKYHVLVSYSKTDRNLNHHICVPSLFYKTVLIEDIDYQFYGAEIGHWAPVFKNGKFYISVNGHICDMNSVKLKYREGYISIYEDTGIYLGSRSNFRTDLSEYANVHSRVSIFPAKLYSELKVGVENDKVVISNEDFLKIIQNEPEKYFIDMGDVC